MACGWLLAALSPAAGGAEAPGETLAHRFAGRLRADLRQLLYEGACLDAVSGNEVVEAAAEWRRRQVELRDRLAQNDGQVVAGEASEVLANAALLALPAGERLAALRRVDRYLAGFADHFAASLRDAGLVAVGEPWPGWLAGRLALPLRFQARHFGRRGPSLIAAMYYQPANLVLVNLAVLVDCPDAFVDAFEHELWHHLLPIPAGRQLADNLWWEGANEAVAEWWAYHLHRRLKLAEPVRRTVEYPVDTALMSWLLAVDRRATVRHLAGEIDRAEWLAELAKCPRRGGTIDRVLGVGMRRLEDDRRQRVEGLLDQWRWQGRDGAAVSVAHLLVDGWPQPLAIEQALAEERQLLMDFIQAWSVTLLQDLRRQVPGGLSVRGASLPPLLRDNLRRVLEYIDDPYYQLANR